MYLVGVEPASKKRRGLNPVCIPVPPQIQNRKGRTRTFRNGFGDHHVAITSPFFTKLRPGFEPGKPDYKAGVLPLKLSEQTSGSKGNRTLISRETTGYHRPLDHRTKKKYPTGFEPILPAWKAGVLTIHTMDTELQLRIPRLRPITILG